VFSKRAYGRVCAHACTGTRTEDTAGVQSPCSVLCALCSAPVRAAADGDAGWCACAERACMGIERNAAVVFPPPFPTPRPQTQGASPGSARQMPTARRPLIVDERHYGSSYRRGAAPADPRLARARPRAAQLRLKGGRFCTSIGCLERTHGLRTRAHAHPHALARTPAHLAGASVVTCPSPNVPLHPPARTCVDLF
jgi:hypothetical protein